jgi:hypothetical protein
VSITVHPVNSSVVPQESEMKKTILLLSFLILLLAAFSGFTLSRSSQEMNLKTNVKDLPNDKLRLIGPSDPSFEERLKKELRGESVEVIDALRPFSVFLENKGGRSIVAYMVQWCFTRADGSNQCYRKAVLNPQALMDGENLSSELERQSGRIAHDSAIFLSLLSPDGSGILRVEISAQEAESIRQGKRFEQSSLWQRFHAYAGRFAQVTVSIDAAFFEDGTFVGPNTTGFFEQAKAVIDAKRDFLNELEGARSKSKPERESFYARLQETASQRTDFIDAKSTPTDYYNCFKNLAASEFLQMKKTQGEENAIAMVLRPARKPWVSLHKKN